jgi:hypothetical protein
MTDDIRRCDDLDERLAPYVDGESTPATRRSVETHLALCPPCRERAESEGAAREVVQQHRTALRGAAPESLRARCSALANQQSPIPVANPQSAIRESAIGNRKSPIVRRWVPLSLAATILLAVGGVFLFGLNDRVQALAASLAIDHIKCFKTTNRSSMSDSAAAAVHWQQDQGWPITVPQTEPSEQLRLVDVRRCFSSDGRAAHMMYSWRGAPLSVYVLQGDIGSDRVVDKMGREAVIWCANRRTYAVVADGHPQDLSHIVAYMKTRVQ